MDKFVYWLAMAGTFAMCVFMSLFWPLGSGYLLYPACLAVVVVLLLGMISMVRQMGSGAAPGLRKGIFITLLLQVLICIVANIEAEEVRNSLIRPKHTALVNFKQLDADSNGLITKSELEKWLDSAVDTGTGDWPSYFDIEDVRSLIERFDQVGHALPRSSISQLFHPDYVIGTEDLRVYD